ncbi:MAG: Ig-like domain-containing protein, partial [Muribaculaceae bacterium]|nr:Ig-like domain-containing protein [Muribaculaceae bacterium]
PVLPAYATNRAVIWQSSANDVASVDGEGKVTALAEGTAVITALAADGSGVSDKCTVSVERVRATSITIESDSAEVKQGESVQLKAVVLPAEAKSDVEWSSQDTSVATVDASGNVVGLAIGRTTISATTTDGSNLTAFCQLKVNEPGAVGSVVTEVFTIGVENGSEIVISGVNADEVVHVINTAGVEVYTGTAKRISGLRSGIYVVVVNSVAAKVNLK